MKKLLLGNEAVARGLYEAGVETDFSVKSGRNFLHRPTRVFRHNSLEFIIGTLHLLDCDFDVADVTLGTGTQIMEQDFGVGHRVTLALRSVGEDERTH